MEIDKNKVLASDLITLSDFAKSLSKKGVTSESIKYHFGIFPGSPDNLDYVQIGRDRFVVNNERAKSFSIGDNYWTRRNGYRKSDILEESP